MAKRKHYKRRSLRGLGEFPPVMWRGAAPSGRRQVCYGKPYKTVKGHKKFLKASDMNVVVCVPEHAARILSNAEEQALLDKVRARAFTADKFREWQKQRSLRQKEERKAAAILRAIERGARVPASAANAAAAVASGTATPAQAAQVLTMHVPSANPSSSLIIVPPHYNGPRQNIVVNPFDAMTMPSIDGLRSLRRRWTRR